jgi:myo-inositol-1(or 4)-monophosphatase
MRDFLEICETAARAAGEVLQDFRGRFTITPKGPKDLVTDADLAAQNVIRQIVLGAFPDHRFLGEEGEHDSGSSGPGAGAPLTRTASGDAVQSPYRWIVDPLDGTSNYIHGLPSYSVSVALELDGHPIAGVVYDPWLDECYAAARGKGAFLNKQPIHPSSRTDISDALVAVSFPALVCRDSVEVRRFVEVLCASHGIRRLGAASLNLCYVASGRLDGYFASSIKSWDVAAGVLILREAGGVVSSLNGGEFVLDRPAFACAATPALHRQLVATLARAE